MREHAAVQIYSLIYNLEFLKHREVLKAKRKQLKGKGKIEKQTLINHFRKQTEKLYEEGYLGINDRQVFQSTVWLNNYLQLRLRYENRVETQ